LRLIAVIPPLYNDTLCFEWHAAMIVMMAPRWRVAVTGRAGLPAGVSNQVNVHVLLIRDRLPAAVRSRWIVCYDIVRKLIRAFRGLVRDVAVLLSHLSAEIVPRYYWHRMKRLVMARRSQHP
jgi:hypothetical protein